MYGSGGGYRPRGGRGPAQPAPRNSPYVPPNRRAQPPQQASLDRVEAGVDRVEEPGQRRGAWTPARSLDRVEAAVAAAQRDLLAAGEHVSSWKLAHSAALSLHVDSWRALGFKYYEVPSLRAVQSIEAKINSFIDCFVGVRRMTSVHELETELCRSEGVEKYEELGLGPLLRHPLVHHYFSVPADAEEVCKITVEDLVTELDTLLYEKHNMPVKHKEIAVEEFLDYLVQKHSAASREALGVRIQFLGLYIKFIRLARRSEFFSLKSIEESGLLKKEEEKPPEPDVFLDHLNSFASWFEDENDDAPSSSSAQGQKLKKGNEDSCSNLVAVDEMKHLGLKLATFNDLGNGETSGEEGFKSYQVIETVPEKAGKLKLEDEDLKRFVMTWKGVCQKHSVAEALAVMLHTYIASDKRKRKMQGLFLSYPAVGLLNVAVRFIKSGEVGCTFKDRNEQESQDTELVDAPAVALEPERDDDKIIEETKNSEPKLPRVSVEDIIGQISKYLELDHDVPRQKDLALEKQLVLRDCEIWVKTQFSVKDFKFLGHGTFFEILEKNAFQLPNELNHLLTGGKKSSLVVSILHQQLLVLLSQAAKNRGGNNNLTKQFISFILKKQFPILSFQIMGTEGEEAFLGLTKNQENCDSFCPVLFSAALFGHCCSKNLKSQLEKFTEPEDSKMAEETAQLTSTYGPVAAKDAIECLLKAPMLSDLQSWSHWDLIFAPSLGPLLHWLLNVGPIKELLCIVTSGGRIVRIDQSANPGEFFEATTQGLPSKAAVKLLSLFCLSGGSNNFPLSLLKCHAQRAIDILIKKFMDHLETESTRDILANRSSLDGQMIDNVDSVSVSSAYLINTADSKEDSKISENLHRISKAYSAVSMFILDCLGQLPSEFRSLAADVLLSGLRSFTKDAAIIILSECNQISERIMLHDIGLSLGIVEWISDFHAFSSDTTVDLFMHSGALNRRSKHCWPEYGMYTRDNKIGSKDVAFSADGKRQASFERDYEVLDGEQNLLGAVDERDHGCLKRDHEVSSKHVDDSLASTTSLDVETLDATLLIESIRSEEFGLDSNQKDAENTLLKKQHARLGRALHCLSQELYSNDSHFLLELVQNADDNSYPESVEPTMVFILQHNGIVVLNNEKGFSAENIRALCDVGSSTKKGSSAGYIGKKGIGFKSVFRVTDAPEIHSNGFHVKFDKSDGQIGFVLPTVIPPCDIKLYQKQLSCDFDRTDVTSWNTCIVLPFKPKQKRGMGMTSIISMFSDLHPSLLLFLHRLQCIKFKNMIDGKLVVMRRTNLKDGIVMVSRGKEKMSWLVVGQNLQASTIRPEIQTTKISIAFPLQESDEGHYSAHLDQQPAFAFLPLRKYGLKCILQGDFVLPSSREEIHEDNAWNQWLLSEFPSLFVSAENSFCALPCFQESPAKAVTTYMSFIPLLGEVYGFFSQLPRMIISKLRTSNCLLLDGPKVEWVPPCRVLRGWNGEAHTFLSESLLQQLLGLGFLNKDIILPDSLARALGIREYGPKFLVEILSSMHQVNGNLKALTLDWLSSWLNALYTSLSVHSSGYLKSENIDTEADIINNLREIPFIPLSDGLYSSVAEGAIWLPCDASNFSFESNNGLKCFPYLFAELRTVTPLLFSTSRVGNTSEETIVGNLIRILRKIGVQQLSAHEVIRNHILPSISNGSSVIEDSTLMIEYLSFVMIHLQFACPTCETERSSIISNLQMKPILLTNHGYKCPIKEPIHFGKAFGNSIDVKKLFGDMGIRWHEIDVSYLKHPSSLSLSFGLTKWREFFQELGVTDFVQIIHSEKNTANLSYSGLTTTELFVQDWESPELVHLLTTVSSSRDLVKSRHLLEVLDNIWDDYFCPKLKGNIVQQNEEYKSSFELSLVKSIKNINWVACSVSKELHYPQELFYDCESVRSVLGDLGPYAVPKVTSKKFLEDIGFKVQVALDDALKVMQSWKNFQNPRASISQMSKFYSFILDELATSLGKISEVRSNLSIFIPWAYTSKFLDVVPGKFMSAYEVYWHDPTGCMGHMREAILQHVSTAESKIPSCVALADFYPGLHDFFVNECCVLEVPPFGKYLEILLQLSSAASPSEAAADVFQVLLKWADDLKSGQMKSEEMEDLEESLLKLENTVLPTMQGKWVSLHPSFGLVCWCDDEELMEQCMHLDDVYCLEFGELTVTEKEMLSGKVAALLRNIGIPALSKVIWREAIFYGRAYTTEKASLVNWILPYAQRYLYKLHPDTYFQLKESAFKKISELRVIEVDKLYYKNTLMGDHIANSKRIECSCLLQGNNILYTDQTAESHLLFLELSRLFFHGVPEVHMANFLHMLTIKAELEYTNEQLESFIINSLKLPKIPDGEPTWSLTKRNDNSIYAPISASPRTFKRQYPNLFKNPVNQSSCPPRNMTRDPDFSVPGPRLTCTAKLNEWDTIFLETPEEDQLQETGRLGETIAFKYFIEKLNRSTVEWVNEESEMGLPYDLIIGKGGNKEYIEVKATRSTNKDWFPMSVNEWHCAAEKGASYSIARVVISSATNATVLVLKNPLRLCQENVLQLAILGPCSTEKSAA